MNGKYIVFGFAFTSLHCVEDEKSYLAGLSNVRGAYAKGKSVKSFIMKQFGDLDTTLEANNCRITPTEPDPRKRRAS